MRGIEMTENYWTRMASSRLRRRQFLGRASLVTAGAAALPLVGCGDDDDDTSNSGDTGNAGDATSPSGATGSSTAASGATETGSPAAESPKKGGTYNAVATNDIATIDPYAASSAAVKQYGGFVYSRLFRFTVSKLSPLGTITERKVEGDLATGFEMSSDGLTYTVKLNPKAKWHPPINRPVDAEDVVFSWKRFTGQLEGGKPFPNSERFSYLANVAAPDAQTVVFTLKQKYGPFIEALADANLLYVMPKETGTAFDPALAMVGSGPWLFDKYTPGSFLGFKRNPEWHFGPDQPYLDAYNVNIVKDAATRLNQFLAGNIDAYGANGIDMAQIKSSIPNVGITRTDSGLAGQIGFSQVSNQRADAPWTDIRVRQALSMALDRDGIVTVAYNPDAFEKAGVKSDWGWQGTLPSQFGDLAIDPKADAELKKYFTYDPKAAKALLDEAGGGFDIDVHWYNLAAEQQTIVQVVAKYWGDIGVKANIILDDYASVFIPQTYRGNFNGAALSGFTAQTDAGQNLAQYYDKDATNNYSKVNDERIQNDLATYFQEADAGKRATLIKDLQKYMLTQLYYVPSQWGALPATTCTQPNVRGIGVGSVGYGALGQTTTLLWKA